MYWTWFVLIALSWIVLVKPQVKLKVWAGPFEVTCSSGSRLLANVLVM
jgi:hypothetical protein